MIKQIINDTVEHFRKTKKNNISISRALLKIPYKAYDKYFNIKRFSRKITKNSIFYFDNELKMCSLFPQKILDKVIGMHNPGSVLDIGCGIGRSLDYFISKNIKAMGVEGSGLAISKANHPELIIKFNLNNELKLNKKFDLVWSFEVAEHIHEKYVDYFIKSLVNHSNIIVISAAPPGQGGEGHFNEQPPKYWIKKFNGYGYDFNEKNSKALHIIEDKHSENMLIFEKLKIK